MFNQGSYTESFTPSGFFSVLGEKQDSHSFQDNLIYRMLKLKQANPLSNVASNNQVIPDELFLVGRCQINDAAQQATTNMRFNKLFIKILVDSLTPNYIKSRSPIPCTS